jgi:hypothetical protein
LRPLTPTAIQKFFINFGVLVPRVAAVDWNDPSIRSTN